MNTEPDVSILINLLRESLPYLEKLELSPSTSVVLRALIDDILTATETKAKT